MLKRLVKQRKHYISLARKSSKTGRVLSENGRLEMLAKNGRFPAKMGGLESLRKLKFKSLLGLMEAGL